MGITFINPVTILKQGESPKIVLYSRQFNTMIDKNKKTVGQKCQNRLY